MAGVCHAPFNLRSATSMGGTGIAHSNCAAHARQLISVASGLFAIRPPARRFCEASPAPVAVLVGLPCYISRGLTATELFSS